MFCFVMFLCIPVTLIIHTYSKKCFFFLMSSQKKKKRERWETTKVYWRVCLIMKNLFIFMMEYIGDVCSIQKLIIINEMSRWMDTSVIIKILNVFLNVLILLNNFFKIWMNERWRYVCKLFIKLIRTKYV